MKPLLTIYLAGSLRPVITRSRPLIEEVLGVDTHCVAGPAGLLARRLIAGEEADLFLSADLGYARELAEALGLPSAPVPLVGNRLGLYVRPEMAAGDAVATLSNPDLRIGTSTPGSDPCGDYTKAFLERIDVLHPAGGEPLVKRARALVGGPATPPLPAGSSAPRHFILEEGVCDAFIGYTHNHAELTRDGRLVMEPLPDELVDAVVYSITALTTGGERARSAFLSGPVHEALLEGGFEPV